jgi:hypothetical protein
MTEKSKQRIDADNAFLRVQTQSMVRERLMSETDIITHARDANTARLRDLRLQKEAQARDPAHTLPAPKSRRPI